MDSLVIKMDNLGLDRDADELSGYLADLDLDDETMIAEGTEEYLSYDEKIEYIRNYEYFSDQMISDILSDDDWYRLKYCFAEKTGYLGDVHLYEVVFSEYIKTLDIKLLECMFLGATEGGHIHIMEMLKEYDLKLDGKIIMSNVLRSRVDEAIKYVIQSDFVSEEDVLYGIGATNRLDLIESLIYLTTADIAIPLYSACEHGKIEVVHYYYETLGIGKSVNQYKLLAIVLDNGQYRILEYLKSTGLDLEPVYNNRIYGFDYLRYVRLLKEYEDLDDIQ